MTETDTVLAPKTASAGNKQAFISLSDKKDLAFVGNGPQELGYAIVSTGGTVAALESAGVTFTKVEQLTNQFPKMLNGHVRTLHSNTHGIGTFDVVVVNLYLFYDKVTSAGGIGFEDGIENIDISGPAMIRPATKNDKDVSVVVDSENYTLPSLDKKFRLKPAWKAFQHVASYDSAVSELLRKQSEGDNFPPSYGENPHQKVAFHADESFSEFNAGGIYI